MNKLSGHLLRTYPVPGPDCTYISLLNPNKVGGLDTFQKCMYLIFI